MFTIEVLVNAADSHSIKKCKVARIPIKGDYLLLDEDTPKLVHSVDLIVNPTDDCVAIVAIDP